jgi:hypothetical protein
MIVTGVPGHGPMTALLSRRKPPPLLHSPMRPGGINAYREYRLDPLSAIRSFPPRKDCAQSLFFLYLLSFVIDSQQTLLYPPPPPPFFPRKDRAQRPPSGTVPLPNTVISGGHCLLRYNRTTRICMKPTTPISCANSVPRKSLESTPSAC